MRYGSAATQISWEAVRAACGPDTEMAWEGAA